MENRSLADCRRALAPTGTLILNSGSSARGPAGAVHLLRPLVLSPFSRQTLRRYVSFPKRQDLVDVAGLLEAGRLAPVIDRVFPLAETPAAIRHIETGHVRGKDVVTV